MFFYCRPDLENTQSLSYGASIMPIQLQHHLELHRLAKIAHHN